MVRGSLVVFALCSDRSTNQYLFADRSQLRIRGYMPQAYGTGLPSGCRGRRPEEEERKKCTVAGEAEISATAQLAAQVIHEGGRAAIHCRRD